MAATIRKAVALDRPALDRVANARRPGSLLNAALVHLAGPEVARSEAAALAALIRLGLEVVQDEAMKTGYEALAGMRNDEDAAFRAAIRSRRERGL